MEERVTRLETQFEHIQADVTEMKAGIHQLDQKIDRRFEQTERRFEQIDQRFEKVDQRFDALRDAVSDLNLSMESSFHRIENRMERSIYKLTLWGIGLYLALASSLLGVMAKGFGWIQ